MDDSKLKKTDKNKDKFIPQAEIEKTLVSNYRKAKDKHKEASNAEKTAKAEVLMIEEELIEFMTDKQIERTAKYPGIGFVTLNKPKVRAHCNEADKEQLFTFLKKKKRSDMIKTGVTGLDKFVAGILAEGKEPPKFISYYLQNNLTLTKK